MRIRILKQFISSYGGLKPGQVIEIPDKIAQSWCADGLAMQDKSLDGARETKAKRKSKK